MTRRLLLAGPNDPFEIGGERPCAFPIRSGQRRYARQLGDGVVAPAFHHQCLSEKPTILSYVGISADRQCQCARCLRPMPGVEVADAQKLLDAYQAAVAGGAASIRLGDQIIDSGTAHQAQALIDRAAACEAHDKAKVDALAGRPVPAP